MNEKSDESMTNIKLSTLLEVLRQVGFSGVIAFALLFGVWVFGDRVTSAHLETLKVMQQSVVQQSGTLERIADRLESSEINANARARILETILEEQKKTTKGIESLGGK